MAFMPYSADVDKTLPNEALPAVAGDYVVGQALFLENGKLTTASDTNAAQYIGVQRSEGHKDGELLAVHRLYSDVRYQTTAPLQPTIGVGYDVAADGLALDTTSATANFTVEKTWTDVNGVFWVIGRFVCESLLVRMADVEARLDAASL
ncbi:MAG: hypothetical protein LBS51_08555 [Oscillospiraceae bacterium]|jgi:hypothetical protein|nr:hypothetical protein [Oscillospiraceae bacterium]